MGILCVQNQYIFIGIESEIWWKTINEPSYNKLSVTANLNDVNSSHMIKDVILSQDELYLATLTSDKYIMVYKSPDFTFHCQYQLPRAASKIAFSKNSQLLLVADKTGDALIYNVNSNKDGGTKALGHLSLLTGIIMTPNNKFIITCDRDEKIRVSNYPGTYNIEAFCLGHKEFITSIHLLPHNEKYLLSTSGDGTVKIWEYLIGKEVCSLDVNSYIDNGNLILDFQKTMKDEDIQVQCLPINHSSCCRKNETSSLLALSLHTHTAILVFEISDMAQSFTFTLIDKIMLKNQSLGIAITPDHLWLALLGDSLKLEQWCESELYRTESKYSLKSSEEIESKNIDIIDGNEITLFYKRKFDNLQEYQKKKKQRLGIE